MVLSAGRKVPRDRGNGQRGEGVALILSGPAVDAWRTGGSQWKAWGSRLITATLEIGNGKGGQLHVLSCYAPNFAASRENNFNLFQYALIHSSRGVICHAR